MYAHRYIGVCIYSSEISMHMLTCVLFSLFCVCVLGFDWIFVRGEIVCIIENRMIHNFFFFAFSIVYWNIIQLPMLQYKSHSIQLYKAIDGDTNESNEISRDWVIVNKVKSLTMLHQKEKKNCLCHIPVNEYV